MIRLPSVLLALAIALGGAVGADAHFAQRQSSISQYLESTELVVRGVIERSDQRFENGHSPRDASGVVRIQEVLKGTSPGRAPLRFETTGVHQPKYTPGKHVLLFLEKLPGSGHYRTRQSTVDAVDLDGKDGQAVLATVRAELEILAIADPALRLTRLKQGIMHGLDSPTPLLWQDALYDLSKRTDLALDDRDVVRLERIALSAGKPNVLRVGCVAKLSALGKTGQRRAMAALGTVLGAKGELIVRTMAAAAIADAGSALGAPALVQALGDENTPVRRAAADGLGRLREAAAVDALANVARADGNDGVRFAALKAIARIGGTHADETLGELAANPKFPDTARSIELARQQVAKLDGRGQKP